MSIDVLDIPLFDRSLASAVKDTVESCLNGEGKMNLLISATGAHGLVCAKKDRQFARTLQQFYRNLPDGMPSVWIGRLKGAREMQRCYGPDFFELVMRASSKTSIRHFFCGGKEGVAEELKNVCRKRFGNENCTGIYTPPFRDLSEIELGDLCTQISELQTDILWVALSTPKQELFAYRLSKYVSVHFIITVGAAFDFHTGRLRKAPQLVQNLGFEWLFRLAIEPRRLYKRYFEIVPLFIFYGIQDLIKATKSRRRRKWDTGKRH